MAYNQDSFGVNGDVSQRGRGPTLFTYATTDIKSVVLTPGYFAGAKDYLDLDSVISIQCPCGTWMATVSSLSPVTVEDRVESSLSTNLSYGVWSQSETPIVLSNAAQYFMPDAIGLSKNVDYADGVFTIKRDGIWRTDVERVYTNTSVTANPPYTATLKILLNEELAEERSVTIPNAQSPVKPSFTVISTPFLVQLYENDTVSVTFESPDAENSDLQVVLARIVAHKID